jgi:hypothetical protein
VASKGLFRVTAESYGASYQNHLLEQYKLYVQMADHVSERRTAANNYLITVNGFLVTLYALAGAVKALSDKPLWQYVVPLAGIFICIAWAALIASHRNLNTVKFAVIHELEARLPAALYAHEWEVAEQGKGSKYLPVSHVELVIPWVFAGLYIVLMMTVPKF